MEFNIWVIVGSHPTALFLIQLPTNEPRKAADGPGSWFPAIHVGDYNASGFGLRGHVGSDWANRRSDQPHPC